MQKIINFAPRQIEKLVIQRQRQEILLEVILSLAASREIEAPFSHLDAQAIFCRQIIAATAERKIEKEVIVMNDRILELDIGIEDIGLNAIASLVIGVIYINRAQLQLPIVLHLIKIAEACGAPQRKSQAVGVNSVVIVMILRAAGIWQNQAPVYQ